MIADLAVYFGCVLLLLGAAFTLLAAIGVLRLPDLLTRMHAASKAGIVGGGLILLAVALVSFDAAVALRAIIGIAFLVLTTPVSAHLLAKVSYRFRTHSDETLLEDEIKSKSEQTPQA